MNVSILLRLLPLTADDEPDLPVDVRGQAEVVETGETALFKDGPEMLAFLRKVIEQLPRD